MFDFVLLASMQAKSISDELKIHFARTKNVRKSDVLLVKQNA